MDAQLLEERRKGLGGSDCAAILGISKWKTPLNIYQDKRREGVPIEENEAMFWGTTLEPIIRQRYSDVTGREVLLPKGIIFSAKYPFMLANIDGFTPCKRGVEIKTARYAYDWGEEGTDEIPVDYMAQCQHYMIVTGLEVFDVPVLISGSDFRIYTVEADKELQEMIIEKEAAFWKQVEEGIPPEPISLAEINAVYNQVNKGEAVASNQALLNIEELIQTKLAIKNLTENAERIELLIKQEIKGAELLTTIDGKVLATWKQSKAAERIDSKRLKAEKPEIFSQYLQDTKPTRRFILKGA